MKGKGKKESRGEEEEGARMGQRNKKRGTKGNENRRGFWKKM